jgi:site-specific DNA-methyltransferase (adenine-specific)
MIRREVQIGDCRLLLGDAMAILPSLDPVQLVVSDVPYALTTGGVSKSSKTMSGIFAAHNYANDGQLIMATVPFPEMPTANRWYMKNLEFTLYLWKGRARTINNPSSKQLLRGGIEKESGHPTEKPVHLMAEYIANSSMRGQTILDPFMGSGTTGVACAQLGRRFIGIEIDEAFFDIACERVEDAYRHPQMFAPDAPEPKQESLFNGEAA